MSSKIIDPDRAKELCDEVRAKGGRIVFTNGCFDLIHMGHVEYLRKARSTGDYLVVGLNTDDSVKRLKGNDRPIISQEARANVLAAMEMVDAVVLFDEDTPARLIEAIQPDVLVKGGDYRAENIAGATFVKGIGGEIVIIPFLEGYSTSSIVRRIKEL